MVNISKRTGEFIALLESKRNWIFLKGIQADYINECYLIIHELKSNNNQSGRKIIRYIEEVSCLDDGIENSYILLSLRKLTLFEKIKMISFLLKENIKLRY